MSAAALYTLLLWHILGASATANYNVFQTRDVTDCSCGYYDSGSGMLFTDATIVYFNETTVLPHDVFEVESYENKYEKGWNTRYRQGANASNVVVGIDDTENSTDTSLELYVEPSTPNHLVIGGGIRTIRHDIHYGSFRVSLRSPRSWHTGSALSMTLDFNDTQTINFDLMNPDDPSKAWVGMLVRDEFPDRDLGVNYSTLSNSTNQINPWDFTEIRIDWTDKEIKYFIGSKVFRTIARHGTKDYPQTPTPIRLKHWSVGDWFTMQGPPKSRSVANVAWTRLFFNSSVATDQDRHTFFSQCSVVDACPTEDMTLRGQSAYTLVSTAQWTQAKSHRGSRRIPIIIMIICGATSFFLLTNASLRRLPSLMSKAKFQSSHKRSKQAQHHLDDPSGVLIHGQTTEQTTNHPSPSISRSTSYYEDKMTIPSKFDQQNVLLGDYIHIQMNAVSSSKLSDGASTPQYQRVSWREYSGAKQSTSRIDLGMPNRERSSFYRDEDTVSSNKNMIDDEHKIYPADLTGQSDKIATRHTMQCPENCEFLHAIASPPAVYSVQTAEKSLSNLDRDITADFCSCEPEIGPKSHVGLIEKVQVNYLAGLLAFSCVLITIIQFCLTFSPASVDPGADTHYKLEMWSRKTVDAYFLNLVWVGPFLITSARFLVSHYFESDGDLLEVAQKVISRPFRLLIPVLAVTMLEYFLMDSGAVNWLEYLSSVTWSTWPFTRIPNNFGHFISEIIELAYLIPNAAPQITFNFCTGVLWTIPVQLQGSWLTLLGMIVVREIRTPWKRFGYYMFCLLIHWYALSWGTYFYFGIMIADLEINFQTRKWIQRQPWVFYPAIFISIAMVLGGLSLDLITQWTNINYAAFEYGIHADIPTGLPIMFTGAQGYPQYYVPKLNGIVFAFGLQSLVELSPSMQALFSSKVLLAIFPHIFTIYLIHGFVFWSLGSTVFVYLASQDVTYWQMVLIAAVCCYAALLLGVPVLTPVLTTLGKSVPANIWVFAHENPSPRKPTLHPFPTNFLFIRQAYVHDAGPEEAAQQAQQVLVTKSRGRFTKFVAGLAAAFNARYSNQPGKPNVSVTRSGSVRRQSSSRVGWRTAQLPKEVTLLKRNNTASSRSSPQGI